MTRSSDTRQQQLFEVADRPVPFSLTPRGRRVVDPATPDLRVVPDVPATSPDAPEAAPDAPEVASPDGPEGASAARNRATVSEPDAVRDARVTRQLDELHGPMHARVRALRRGGGDRVEIARQLDLDPHVVAVMDAPSPAHGEVAQSPRPAHPDPDAAQRRAAAIAVLATVGDVDGAGVTVTTDRIGSAAVVVDWLRDDLQVSASSLRVVLRVAAVATGDIVAHAWADRLGLGRDRVSTVAWSDARGPRDVQAVLRVNGRAASAAVADLLDQWPHLASA